MLTQWFKTVVFAACCAAVLLTQPVRAQRFTPAATKMFLQLNRQPNDLARYVYLIHVTPKLPAADQQLGMQMFSTVESGLGLYNEALRDFPLKSHTDPGIDAPKPAEWERADAAPAIAKLVGDRPLVLINEAHHDAHTRQLTLALLPRLRALGFNYFAAEALVDRDNELQRRGYPIKSSGSDYLHEPSYGEIVRTALKLGFTVVAYDVDSGTMAQRESGQANNLYKRVFAKDPRAKLFVHAGYAHIDKARGRLGNVLPMAARLQELSGIEPFSVNQTQFREQIPSEADAYQALINDFRPEVPSVLLNRSSGIPWTAHPDRYDVNVILPPSGQGALASGHMPQSTIVHNMNTDQPMLARHVNSQRPEWLTLNNTRTPYKVSTLLCKVTIPCVVDAHYADESNDATAADRYAFMHGDTVTKLYLLPGRYRLRAWDVRGKTLSERIIEIGNR